jgi:MoaA/NifB/PqqE/SkfB family radical SAM enzyme
MNSQGRESKMTQQISDFLKTDVEDGLNKLNYGKAIKILLDAKSELGHLATTNIEISKDIYKEMDNIQKSIEALGAIKEA